eukprot:TRINITY_DN65588_c0_g1_i1.p1 TRINITY_DN65588_c0_g1~~TRINITY_DN65588_c0_g1_i1.p1  ORF type:complete len:383 (+),score=36.47 TRINITY_DN65588_c0_g1_i1:77-1225(+)
MAASAVGLDNVDVTVRNLASIDLVSMSLPADTSGVTLKDCVARSLDMCPFGIELISANDGVTLHDSDHLTQLCDADARLELTLIQRDIPRASSSRFARVQSTVPEDSKPTYHGRQGSGWATIDVLAPRCMLFAITLIVALNFFETYFWAMALFYLVYLVEALRFNATARGLRHINDTESISAYIQRVKDLRPVPKIEAHCWHYETRTRIVTDAHGQHRRETSRDKVFTQRLTEPLRADTWADASGDIVEGLHYLPLLQVHFEATWEAGDEHTATEHERQRNHLRTRAQAADDHFDWSETLWFRDSDGIECQLPCTDMIGTPSHSLPSWLSWNRYIIVTFFGLSWPYRWFLARKSVKGDFVFKKVIGSQQPGVSRSRSRSRSR